MGGLKSSHMKKVLCLGCWLLVVSIFAANEEEETTLTRIGQAAPEIRVTTLDGKNFDLKEAKGKVVLINFFATWCGPCMAEMPHLQNQIWSRFKDKNFVVVAIDREEAEPVVKDFQKRRQFGFAIACDPRREAYSKFATKFIPRNFLIDANGIIVFQSVGYSAPEFNRLLAEVEKQTAKPH
ncbi:MAG TPA: TlpA disulfide reductase family protein [Verrucomicrobiae bacterium]|nr:TlpA disulfide reductase family protein [Verrucomicrobiae bacterium]